jgi:hypothetical protein
MFNGNVDARANLIANNDLISVDGGSSYNRVAEVNATAIIVSTAPGSKHLQQF